jgi:MSHA biogenesis protein MshP
MKPDSAAGFALPAALFLLVVLGGLAAWLMRMTELSMAQDALEIEGERAYQAAQAGLEAGIYAARNGSCAGQNIAFADNLARFTASVACTAHTADEGGTTVTLYEITSIACNQPDGGACPNGTPTLPEYTERHVRAVVEGG